MDGQKRKYFTNFSMIPTSSEMNAYKEELSEYRGTKDSVHFPLTKPLPSELINKIVK